MRSRVEIVQVRAADLQGGDVVNRRGADRSGWMEVASLERLENGSLIVHDEANRDSFTAVGYDLVWLQIVVELHHNSHLAMPARRT